MRLLALWSASAACLLGQSYAGPRCEPHPELQKSIQEIWQDTAHPLPGRVQWQVSQWERSIEKHPRETVLHRRYYLLFRDYLPERVEGVRQRYLQQAERNPGDPLAVYMAGLVLEGIDTPKAIETLERAARLDPAFGWSHLTLAYLYGRGRFQNKENATRNVTAYFRACPQNLEDFSIAMLNQHGTAESMAATAKAMRARLETETDPDILRSYSNLWGLEFKTTPVAGHPEQRERVAADLRRLEGLNPKPDAAWLLFLADAMKQCGREKDVAGMEDRLLREFPVSWQTCRIVRQRWAAAHPPPKVSDPAETWDAYTRSHIATVEGWLRQFPAQEAPLLSLLLDDTTALPPVDPRRVRELGERLVPAVDRESGVASWQRISVAWGAYLRHGVDPKRAIELLESAGPLLLKEQAVQLQRDDLLDKDRTELIAWQAGTQLTWATAMATAYRRAGVGQRAAPLRAVVDGVKASTPELKAQRFAALAALAAAQGRHIDALTLYKAALDTRPKATPLLRGRPNDRVLDGAREVWRLSGGSEDLWALWSMPLERAAREITDSRWEQPRKPLPAFELTDLSGRKWNSKALEGKTLFLNVWATWCGPCVAELPHFQKLYERTKDRDDLAVFSLNIDDDVGLVEPFLREKGLSFPALLAASYVSRTVETLAVPQTWIVDKKGLWLWQQLGYDGDPDWERSMLAKIGAAQ